MHPQRTSSSRATAGTPSAHARRRPRTVQTPCRHSTLRWPWPSSHCPRAPAPARLSRRRAATMREQKLASVDRVRDRPEVLVRRPEDVAFVQATVEAVTAWLQARSGTCCGGRPSRPCGRLGGPSPQRGTPLRCPSIMPPFQGHLPPWSALAAARMCPAPPAGRRPHPGAGPRQPLPAPAAVPRAATAAVWRGRPPRLLR